MKNNMFQPVRFGSLAALILSLFSAGAVRADLQITAVFYGWDEQAAKFQNSNVVIRDDGLYTPVFTPLNFDGDDVTVPQFSAGTPNGYTCGGSSQITSLAGAFELDFYHEDTDGGDGFQSSRNWALVPCNKNYDDGTPVQPADFPVIGGAFNNSDLNNLPAFYQPTFGTTWIELTPANTSIAVPVKDYLVVEKGLLPLEALIDIETPCTTGNCATFLRTRLGVNLDLNCDGAPDTVADGAPFDWNDYIQSTGSSWDPINGGICFYAEIKKPGPELPSYIPWKGPLQARIGAIVGSGDKTVSYSVEPTLAEIQALQAVISDSGEVAIEWKTRVEVGTLGYYLERLDAASGDFVRVNDEQLPALSVLGARQGGSYSIIDAAAGNGGSYSYRLVEEDLWGERIHGPYEVTVNGEPSGDAEKSAASFETIYSNGSNSASARVLSPRTSEAAASSEAGTALVEPTGTARLEVNANGLYEVSATSIAAALGQPRRDVKKAIRQGKLALSSQGIAVPWEAAEINKGIRFYAKAPVENPYTATNVYWLELAPGERISTSAAGTATPLDGQVVAAQQRLEEDAFPLTEAATDADSDYWRWAVMKGGASWNTFTTKVRLHNLADGSAASLALDLQSIRAVTNRVRIRVNGTLLSDKPTWDGAGEYSTEVTIPAGLLREGSNTIRLKTLKPASGDSYVYLDGMTLSFQRIAVAEKGVLEAVAPDNGVLSLDGFANNDIAVYKLGASPERLEGVAIDTGVAGSRVTFSGEAGATYLAVEAGAESTLKAAPANKSSYEAARSIDYLVIADRSLGQGANALAELRTGSGLTTRVVWVDEIDTIINDGVSSPYNIREFLKRTAQDWGVQYAVLAGDACNDYRDLTGLCDNLVSTLMVPTPYGLYACDGCLGDTDGDTLPDVRVSRIPARTDAELLAYVEKLRRYESSQPATPEVFLIADNDDPQAGYFTEDTRNLAQQLTTDAPGVGVETVFLDDVEIGQARTTLLDRLGVNGLWSNYIGHGGGTTLSRSDLLVGGDSELISGGSGVLSAMTCAAAWHDSLYFHSLAEELVLDPDGGPVVAYGPSGLSFNGDAVRINGTLLEEVYTNQNPIIGDAVAAAMQREKEKGEVDDWMRQIYQIIGDVYLLVP